MYTDISLERGKASMTRKAIRKALHSPDIVSMQIPQLQSNLTQIGVHECLSQVADGVERDHRPLLAEFGEVPKAVVPHHN